MWEHGGDGPPASHPRASRAAICSRSVDRPRHLRVPSCGASDSSAAVLAAFAAAAANSPSGSTSLRAAAGAEDCVTDAVDGVTAELLAAAAANSPSGSTLLLTLALLPTLGPTGAGAAAATALAAPTAPKIVTRIPACVDWTTWS